VADERPLTGATPTTVTVRCYGPAERAARARTLEVSVPLPATVDAVLESLEALPEVGAHLAELLPSCAVAVGDEVVPRTSLVHPGQAHAVALLPPVAGG
jgi:molybdopterin converting factor small subunit